MKDTGPQLSPVETGLTPREIALTNVELLSRMMSFMVNPSMAPYLRQVSYAWAATYNKTLQIAYNDARAQNQPSFVNEQGINKAIDKQKTEIKTLLANKYVILRNTPSAELSKAFFQLQGALRKNNNDDTFAFLRREHLIDTINLLIIKQRIRNHYFCGGIDISINCENCHLTRFPKSVLNLTRHGCVKEINLDNNLLQSLPPEIGHYHWVGDLRLNNNQLKSLPESISRMEALRLLTVNNNNLTELPESIVNLRHLRYLGINNNLIEKLPENLRDDFLYKFPEGYVTKEFILASQRSKVEVPNVISQKRGSKRLISEREVFELHQEASAFHNQEDRAKMRKQP